MSSGGDGFPFGGSLGGGGIGGGGGRAGEGGVGDWSFPNSIELDGLFSFGDTFLNDSLQNSPLENVNSMYSLTHSHSEWIDKKKSHISQLWSCLLTNLFSLLLQ